MSPRKCAAPARTPARWAALGACMMVACDGPAPGQAASPPAAPAGVAASWTHVDATDPPRDGEPALPEGGGPLRFLAVGDTGKANDTQARVGDAMARVCASRGCDLVLLLGDVVYPAGVASARDPLWDAAFEDPYRDLHVPFLAVLGNHDYGGDGAVWDDQRAGAYLARMGRSPRWFFPDRYYSVTVGDVTFFGLDTPAAQWWQAGVQERQLAAALGGSGTRWNIVSGHHPILSNGPHGDAGRYERLPWVPLVAGGGVRNLVDGAVCGSADLYLSGHDHSRQVLDETCRGTWLVVSGAGAASTSLPGRHAARFQSASPGFFWFEVDGDRLTLAAYDESARLEFEEVRWKEDPWREAAR